MGILKTLHLIPLQFHLGSAVITNSMNVRTLIDALASDEHGDLELLSGIIGYEFSFPNVVGVKQIQRFCKVRLFAVKTDIVGKSFPVMIFVNTVYLLKVRNCDLCRVLADLYFRNDFSVSLDRGEFNIPANTGALRDV